MIIARQVHAKTDDGTDSGYRGIKVVTAPLSDRFAPVGHVFVDGWLLESEK